MTGIRGQMEQELGRRCGPCGVRCPGPLECPEFDRVLEALEDWQLVRSLHAAQARTAAADRLAAQREAAAWRR